MNSTPDIAGKSELVASALAFAQERHQGQLRKGTDLPYFVHPAGVSSTLWALYGDSELAAAGACHDLLEDTATTSAEIEDRFGPRVAGLVCSVTSPRGRDWSETRARALEQLRHSSDDAIRLKAADALNNASSTVEGIRNLGLSSLARFGASPERIANWYGAIATLARERVGGETLVLLLEDTVSDLRGLLAAEPS
jgi:hypothetical protein